MVDGQPDSTAVIEALRRVLDSGTFRRAPRCRDLLSFVTTETLSGRGHLLNERVVARAALGRPATVDTRTDAGARVQARRTRELLDRYYSDEGRADPLEISIPLGGYAAVFRRRPVPAPGPTVTQAADLTHGPVLAVTQFRHHSAELDRRVAVGLSESLAQTLSRFPGLQVVGPLLADHEGGGADGALDLARRSDADVLLHGAVVTAGETVRVTTHLVDGRSGAVRWSETFERPASDFTGFGAEDEILRHVAATVGDFGGAVLREPFHLRADHPHPEVAEALWRYYAFLDELTPEEGPPVVMGLLAALELEPDNAHVAASLGFAYTVDVLMRGRAAADSAVEAEAYARRALGADPLNAVAHNVLAVVALARDQQPAALRHAEVALEHARHHPGNAYVAGMVIGASGEWDRGISIIRDTVRLNPYGPSHRHTLLAVDALLRDDVAGALAEASFLHFPGYLYGPLLRALCLAELGLADEAADELAVAVALEPDLLEQPAEVLAAAPTIPRSAADHLAERIGRIGRIAGSSAAV